MLVFHGVSRLKRKTGFWFPKSFRSWFDMIWCVWWLEGELQWGYTIQDSERRNAFLWTGATPLAPCEEDDAESLGVIFFTCPIQGNRHEMNVCFLESLDWQNSKSKFKSLKVFWRWLKTDVLCRAGSCCFVVPIDQDSGGSSFLVTPPNFETRGPTENWVPTLWDSDGIKRYGLIHCKHQLGAAILELWKKTSGGAAAARTHLDHIYAVAEATALIALVISVKGSVILGSWIGS